MKITQENTKRVNDWGIRVFATLVDAGLLSMRGEGPERFPWPADEDGLVEGVFVPLGEPATCALVTSLLGQYMERATSEKVAVSTRKLN